MGRWVWVPEDPDRPSHAKEAVYVVKWTEKPGIKKRIYGLCFSSRDEAREFFETYVRPLYPRVQYTIRKRFR